MLQKYAWWLLGAKSKIVHFVDGLPAFILIAASYQASIYSVKKTNKKSINTVAWKEQFSHSLFFSLKWNSICALSCFKRSVGSYQK